MALSKKIFQDDKILLTTWSGEISDTDLLRFYMNVYNQEKWRPGFDEIIDLRDADLSGISERGLKQLSELTTQCLTGESLRLALLAPSNLTHELARIYNAFSHIPNESTKVFHHLSEATDWLNNESD